mmetsp:Transcript_35346/g.60536  ORF Transcript_35346/g.60536 Transcript_35346/m.60536 type:complete len:299 (-) Transcript_35346:9-905(-)
MVDYLTYTPPKPESKLSARPPKPIYILLCIIRFVATWSFLLTTVWGLWLFVPTMLFNPLLRKLGVPNYWLPVDIATRWFAQALLFLAGIRGVSEGNAKEPTVLICNHLSALDSFVVYAFSPVSMRFIMKKTMIYYCPPLFGLAKVVGCITIDRKNREEAISALKRGASKIKQSGRSFIVFPEGTRSRSGVLQPFKKGAFHMAKEANVLLTPAIITGPWDLWPPGTLFPSPGTIKVKVLDSIEIKDKSVDDLLLESRTVIAKAIDEEKFKVHDNGHYIATAPAIGWLILLSWAIQFYFF